MRAAVILAAALVVMTAAGNLDLAASEQTYIVPVTGFVTGANGAMYGGGVRVVNQGRASASVAVTDLVQPPGSRSCSPSGPLTLEPGGIGSFGTSVTDPCRGMFALVIASDQPLQVIATVTTYSSACCGNSEQRIDVPADWVEPGDEALIPDVPIEENLGIRANLFLVNPSDRAITIHAVIARPELALTPWTQGQVASNDVDFDVPAHSLTVRAIPGIPTPPVKFPVVVDAIHHIRLTSTGRFQAGASSVRGSTGQYRPAVRLAPAAP